MADKSILYYGKVTDYDVTATANNIIILANSIGVVDKGQVIINDRQASFGVKFSATDAKLTVGGDYKGESREANRYNIFVNSTIPVDNPIFVADEEYPEIVGAVQFATNGTLVLASQSGNVKANVDYYDTAKEKSDVNVNIAASRSFATDKDEWCTTREGVTINGSLPTVMQVRTILAGSTLTVNGSLVGNISSDVDVDLAGGKSVSGGTATYIDNVSSNQINASTFKAATIVIGGNVVGNLTANATAKLTAVVAPTASSNDITARVFETDDFQLKSGLWAGDTAASVDSVTIDATVKGESAAASGNTIAANALKAANIKIREIGSSSLVSGGQLSASVSNVKMTAKSNGAQESGDPKDASTSMTGNTIDAVVMDGTTLDITTLNADAKLVASASGITLKASGSGKTYSETFTNNVVNAIALRGTTVTLGDMYGTLTANASQITLSGKLSMGTDMGNAVNVYGIKADTLHVTGVMDGKIAITTSSLNVMDGPSNVAGISASTITVDGQIGTDISTTGNSFADKYYGIYASTVQADSYAGTMTVDGSYASGGIVAGYLYTAVAGDSFDINGSITASYCGVVTSAQLNLRVSGSITATAAGLTDDVAAISSESIGKSGTPQDDIVELAAGAKISGDINLHHGENQIILNSMAQLDGSMLSTGGVMNVKFILEDAQSNRAIVQGAASGDVTLTSGNTIIVDLNYAKNGETYKLISYASNAKAYWTGEGAEHKVEFLYHGETRYVKVEGSGRVQVELGDVKAQLYYDEASNSVIVDEISGVEELEAFASIVVDEDEKQYDAEKRLVTVNWYREGVEMYGFEEAYAYELEYTVYRGNEKCGESVLVRMTDSKATSYDIRGIEADQTVKYRMRVIGDANAANASGWSSMMEVSGEAAVDTTKCDFKDKKTTVTDAINGSKTLGGSAALFSWEAANSSNGMASYVLEVYETNDKIELSYEEKLTMTYEEKVSQEIEKARAAGNTYLKTVTNTEAVVTGMQHLAYVYWRVQGTDVAGNVTTWENEQLHETQWLTGLAGDSVAPEFVTAKGRKAATLYVDEDRSIAGQVSYGLVFQWSKAEDSGIGLKGYEIEFTLTSDENWEDAQRKLVLPEDVEVEDSDYCLYTWDEMLPGGEYKYRICALDYANNQSEYIGNETFGSKDVTPPTGAFTSFSKPDIDVEYEYIVEGGTTSTDGGTVTTDGGTTSGGTSSTDGGTSSGGTSTVIISRQLLNATVTFNWNDTYTDEAGVYYKIQFSNSETFATDKTYTYTTTTAGEKSFTIDNSMPTMPVGIFAMMDTVYWRVMAIDANRNETGVYSTAQSFRLVNDDGEKVKHETAPDAPYGLSITAPKVDGVGSGELDIKWCNDHTDLGILYYVIEVSSKDGGDNFKWKITSVTDMSTEEGDYSEISGYLVNPDTASALSDGTYNWSVSAYNAAGKATKTKGAKFVQDTIRPTTVENLEAKVMTSDVALSWDESYDAFKIGGYAVKYRLAGTEYWTTVSTDKTEVMIFGMTEGTYEFCVNAYDKNNNVSLDSDIVEFKVSRGDDLCDTYSPYSWVSYEDAATVDGIGQTVGINDKADYFYIARKGAFSLTVNLTGLAQIYGKKSSLKLVLCKYDGSGEEKALKSISLSGAKYGAISGLMLDGGEEGSAYFFKLTSSVATSSVEYLLDVVTDDYSKANQEADDTAADADVLAARSENPSFVSLTQGVTDEWVGYTDTIDYRKVVLAEDGSYDFTLSDVNGGTQLTLTVWQVNDKGKLKSVKSVKVQGSESGGLSKVLMFKDTTYYVSVEAKNGKKGQCSDYALTMGGTEFTKNNNEDDDWKTLTDAYTVKFGDVVASEWVGYNDVIDYRKIELSNSGSYDFIVTGLDPETPITLTVWQDKGKGKLSSVSKITTKNGTSGATLAKLLLDENNTYYVSVESKNAKKGYSTDYELSFSGVEFTRGNNADDVWQTLPAEYVLGEGEMITDEWVGYGDTVDYRAIKFADSGSYTFTLNKVDANASLTLTVWEVNSKGNLKSVKKVTTKKGAVEATISNLALDSAKSYYLSVEAKNGKKGEYTAYDVAMSGDFVPVANNSDDTMALAKDVDRFVNSSSYADWVGTGDTVDWVELNVDSTKTFDLELDMGDNANVALFEADGETQIALLESSIELEAGKYFLKVSTDTPTETGVIYDIGFDNDVAVIMTKARLA